MLATKSPASARKIRFLEGLQPSKPPDRERERFVSWRACGPPNQLTARKIRFLESLRSSKPADRVCRGYNNCRTYAKGVGRSSLPHKHFQGLRPSKPRACVAPISFLVPH